MSEQRDHGSARSLLMIGVLASAGVWLSCERPKPSAGDQQAGQADSAATTAESTAADNGDAAFELIVVDQAAFDRTIEGLRGQVVLVDCWATWCSPCIEQLPHSASLWREHRDDGLAVVLLSLDSPSDEEAIRAAVTQADCAKLTNLVSEFGTGSESAAAFDIPGGALPHYKIYDRSGELRQTFSLDPAAEKQFTPEDVANAVKELLAE